MTGVIRAILTILLVLISLALIIIVLLQEGKSAGLGSISGAAESYWGKNKSRSMEGTLQKVTKILCGAFIIVSLILTINF